MLCELQCAVIYNITLNNATNINLWAKPMDETQETIQPRLRRPTPTHQTQQYSKITDGRLTRRRKLCPIFNEQNVQFIPGIGDDSSLRLNDLTEEVQCHSIGVESGCVGGSVGRFVSGGSTDGCRCFHHGSVRCWKRKENAREQRVAKVKVLLTISYLSKCVKMRLSSKVKFS